MKPTLGPGVGIDIEALVKTRMLLTAGSGAGKSWALRRILEQTHGKIQHLVIDLEGEFFTLRERFDYVIAGKGGDCVAEPRSAAMLARRLLELEASAVLDLYELNPRDRILFVKNFVDALVDAPKELWHPCLVAIDEVHHFAPEDGSAESEDAIAALMSRGRKRGFAPILSTQRLSKLSKDVAAEAANVVIGRCSLDIDIKRAAKSLGMKDSEGFATLPHLKPGNFYVFGPALSGEVRTVQVGDVSTSHPQAGTMQAKPPAPRAQVLKVLAKLADLPQEAEAEAKTVDELKAKNRSLEFEIKDARIALEDAQKNARKEEVSVLTETDRTMIEEALKEFNRHVTRFENQGELMTREIKLLTEGFAADSADIVAIRDSLSALVQRVQAETSKAFQPTPERSMPRRETRAPQSGGGGRDAASSSAAADLKGPERRILNAIAWLNSIGVKEPLVEAVAFVAEYTPSGGAFANPKGRLNQMGLIRVSGGTMTLTEAGRPMAEHPKDRPTTDEMLRRILGRLDGPMSRVLTPLLAAWPKALGSAEVAAGAGYEPTGGAFMNPRGRLRTLGLVDLNRGELKARDYLFPTGPPSHEFIKGLGIE